MQGRSYEETSTNSIGGKEKYISKVMDSRRSRRVVPTNPRSLPGSLPDTCLSKLDRVSRYYVDYYNERICKLFIVYDSDKNPFRSLIAFGFEDPVLMKALLALAARHHVNTCQSFYQPGVLQSSGIINANQDALAFKHHAIQAVSHYLGDIESPKRDTIIASIFLLIFLDLLECCCRRIEVLGATFLRPKLLSELSPFDQQELQLQEKIETYFSDVRNTY
ncbi:hypothetical protein N7495_002352 [Penicillium taxi]|uniref:uncharacterized protein n=1 Tax=Penicillium taxi TaxID=168475 RepID=UPI002545898D|nr:uncharacterized protein N7495_002352 [Penicillium taxi]KAJ5901824.1 hypothetical protein N7495_002352 [Penicillium taxi]